MFFNAVAESLVKALKNLDSSVERFLSGTGPRLEFSQLGRVLGVRGAQNVRLASVPIVPNSPLPSRDLQQQLRSKLRDIMAAGLERTTHPHELVFVDGAGKLV